ncbi:MAG: lysoplasmalogenase [Clostridia bacterium]|nr:lysoplasmalogenase [Clostridia bacterium]
MKTLGIIFIILFCTASAVHLFDSARDSKRRGITKPMLLVFLLIWYLFAAKDAGKEWNIWLIAAIATSWLGDVLLMPKGNKWFVIGGISFLISHLLFIAVYVPQVDFAAVNLWVIIPVAFVYGLISFSIMYAVRKNTPKPMFAPMLLYLAANSSMNLFALMQFMTLKNVWAAVAYAGAVLFFTSDCTLFLVRYHENKDLIFKKHFTVMFTYIAGEFLITLGILFLT